MVTPYLSNCEIYFCGSFVGVQSSFFHPEVLVSFSFIFEIFCPYLESLTYFHGKDLIVHSL